MNFFRRRRILKGLNYLEATPVRVCEHQQLENGRIDIVVPKFHNPRFNAWFLGRRPKNFMIHLDETGSRTWLLIDGVKNVGEICKELEITGLEEAEKRITKFMTTLYEQRYITFRELMEDM